MSHNPGPLRPTQDSLHFILSLAVSVPSSKDKLHSIATALNAFQWLPSVHRTQSCQGAWSGSALHHSLVGCQVILQASTAWPSANISSHKLHLARARVPPSAQPETHLATPTVDGASSLWALPGLSRPRHLSSSRVYRRINGSAHYSWTYPFNISLPHVPVSFQGTRLLFLRSPLHPSVCYGWGGKKSWLN